MQHITRIDSTSTTMMSAAKIPPSFSARAMTQAPTLLTKGNVLGIERRLTPLMANDQSYQDIEYNANRKRYPSSINSTDEFSRHQVNQEQIANSSFAQDNSLFKPIGRQPIYSPTHSDTNKMTLASTNPKGHNYASNEILNIVRCIRIEYLNKFSLFFCISRLVQHQHYNIHLRSNKRQRMLV
jgi:hypothetical protein